MPKPEINPTRHIDGDKVELFKSKNAPLAVKAIFDAHEQAEREKVEKSRADSEMAARLEREVLKEQRDLNHNEAWFAERKEVSPDDIEFIESCRAKLKAAKERRDKHQKKMQKKRTARDGVAPMPVEQLHKLIVQLFHRPMKSIDFKSGKDGEATIESLTKIFDKMAEHRKEIQEAQDAFLPTDEAFDDFKRDIDRKLKRFDTNPFGEYFRVRYLDGDPRKPQPAQVTLNMENLAMRAVREMILSYGMNVIRAGGERRAFEGEPLSRAERSKIIAEHFAAIDELELSEGRIRRALALKGVFVAVRADTVNLLSVLGVEFDAEAARRKLAENKAAQAA
jgi:hypothetical protein